MFEQSTQGLKGKVSSTNVLVLILSAMRWVVPSLSLMQKYPAHTNMHETADGQFAALQVGHNLCMFYFWQKIIWTLVNT